MTTQHIGSRNERGFINNLLKKGFTIHKSISELVANSIDAKARILLFHAAPDEGYIYLIDDGKGMDREGVTYMLDAERENHQNDDSIGTAGFGSKPSMLKLSIDDAGRYHPTVLYTMRKKGEPLRCVVPWPDIIEQGRWDNMSVMETMSETEQEWFRTMMMEIRQVDSSEVHGTILQIAYSDTFYEALEAQFSAIPSSVTPIDWLSIVYGKCAVTMQLDKGDGTEKVSLRKYNYMDGPDREFYLGKGEYEIEVFRTSKGIEQYGVINSDGNLIGFHFTGKNTKKEIEEFDDIGERIGSLTYTVGMRKDAEYFHPSRPVMPNSETTLCAYDRQFFEIRGGTDFIKEHFSQHKLYRNGQCVTMWHILKHGSDRINYGAARSGGGEKYCEYVLHRGELSYRCWSSQKNVLDNAMGIQQNKTQNQNQFPLALERLLRHIKHAHYLKVWNYFQEVVQLRAQQHTSSFHEEEEKQEEDASDAVTEDALEDADAEEVMESEETDEDEPVVEVEEPEMMEEVAEEPLEPVVAVVEPVVAVVEPVVAVVEPVVAVVEPVVAVVEPVVAVVEPVVAGHTMPTSGLNSIREVYQHLRAQEGIIHLYHISQDECTRNGVCGMEIGISREKDQYAVLKLFLGERIRWCDTNDVPEDFVIGDEKISSKHSSSKVGTPVKVKWTSESHSVEKDIHDIVHAADTYYPHILLTYMDLKEGHVTVIGISSEQNRNTIKTLGKDAFSIPSGNSRGIEYSRKAMTMLLSSPYFRVNFTHSSLRPVGEPIERRMNLLRSMGVMGFE